MKISLLLSLLVLSSLLNAQDTSGAAKTNNKGGDNKGGNGNSGNDQGGDNSGQEKGGDNNMPDNVLKPKCPNVKDYMCSDLYDPVCGYFKVGAYKTYPNLCTACKDKIKGYLKGACCTPNPNPKCTKEYKPICGIDSKGNKKTYSNQCLAQADCATNLTNGACPRTCPPSSVKCSSVYDPVCGTDIYGNKKTYGNACVAKSQCAQDVTNGPCSGTKCTADYTKKCDPKIKTLVASCGIKSDGTAKVYSNDCLACRDGAVTAVSPPGDCKNPFGS